MSAAGPVILRCAWRTRCSTRPADVLLGRVALLELALQENQIGHVLQLAQTLGGRAFTGLGRRAGGGRLPQAAVLENGADQLALPCLDETDDPHGAAAGGAFEGIDLVDALDEARPASPDLAAVGLEWVIDGAGHVGR